MEKHQHNDPLDNYVRQTFDAFEPDPSDLVWNNIEHALDKDDRRNLPLFWRYAATAAILLLSIGLVCNHFYYAAQLQALKSSLQEIHHSQAAKNPPAVPPLLTKQLPAAPNPSDQATLPAPLTPSVPPSQFNKLFPIATLVPAEKPESLDTDAQEPTILRSLATIPVPLTLLEIKEPELSVPNAPYFPKSSKKNWYVHLGFTRPRANERIARLPNAPGGRPPRWQNSEPRIELYEFNLATGVQLTKNWGLETGVCYRKIEKTSVHQPEFKFRDGRPLGGTPSGPPQFDFSYNLETYGGEAAVTVQVEQQDNGQVSPDEPLQLKVSSSESLDVIRWPMLGTARIGTKQVQLTAKAGLMGNFLVQQNLNIKESSSKNGRFLPAQPDRAFTINGTSKGAFFMGYLLSAGVEFKPYPRIGFTLEPTIAGDFTRKSAGRAPLPRLTTTGVQLGLVYWM